MKHIALLVCTFVVAEVLFVSLIKSSILSDTSYAQVIVGGQSGQRQHPSSRKMPDFGFKLKTVSVVTELDPDGPASAAGIKLGDIVLSVNGQETTGNTHAYFQILRSTTRPVQIKIERNSTTKTEKLIIDYTPSHK